MTEREATSQAASQPSGSEVSFKIWQCILCGYIYDEDAGCPEDGIPSGTCWHDVPDDRVCPECSAANGGRDDGDLTIRLSLVISP